MRIRTLRQLKQRNFDNLDASENAFLRQQLEYVKTQMYNRKYPNLRARSFIPVATDVPSEKSTVTYKSYSQVGMAQLLASYADDLPRSDVFAEETSIQVKPIGAAYGYDLIEIRQSQAAGVDLENKKAAAARRSVEILIDRILAVGDSATGLKGLLNQSNTLTFTVPNGGGGVATWANKTASEIIADMVNICEYVATQTNEVEAVDTLLLPRTQFTQISTTRANDNAGSDLTILEYFRRNYPGVTVASWLRLAAAGANSTDRMVAYHRDPDYLQAIIPQEFEQMPAQEKGLNFEVPCHARIGGVIAYYPMSIAYGDGL